MLIYYKLQLKGQLVTCIEESREISLHLFNAFQDRSIVTAIQGKCLAPIEMTAIRKVSGKCMVAIHLKSKTPRR